MAKRKHTATATVDTSSPTVTTEEHMKRIKKAAEYVDKLKREVEVMKEDMKETKAMLAKANERLRQEIYDDNGRLFDGDDDAPGASDTED